VLFLAIIAAAIALEERSANETTISTNAAELEHPGDLVQHLAPDPSQEDQVAGPTVTPTPWPTSTPEPRAPEGLDPIAGDCCFTATRYGVQYEGSGMGCPGSAMPAGRADKLYHSADPAILAAPLVRNRIWECGQGLAIVNPANDRRLEVIRMDTCEGCDVMHVDLSEAGIGYLCGVEYPATCDRLTGLVIEELW
jgi:hypothetical protein